jgi:hypothetical protein
MIKLFFINVLLFVPGIILFIMLAIGIAAAMRPATDNVEVAMAYIGVTVLHIYINLRLLKKWELATLRRKVISTLLIIGAYIGYLFIYHH